MKKLKLSSPWMTYFHQVKAFFEQDRSVSVVFDDETPAIIVYVDDQEKADALSYLLPKEKKFGSLTLQVKVLPANDPNVVTTDTIANIYRTAFKNNRAFNKLIVIKGMTNDFIYVVFEKEVVQYWNDNLGDPHGLCSTLYEDLARAVIDNNDGVMFCTNNRGE